MQPQKDIKSPVGLKVSLGSIQPSTLYGNPVFSNEQWLTSARDTKNKVLKSVVQPPNQKQQSQWDYNYILGNKSTPLSNQSHIISIG